MKSVASVVETVLAHLSPVGWRLIPTPLFQPCKRKAKSEKEEGEKQNKEIFWMMS